MDPFEEFEFKPLTDGLGFHKKAEKLKQDIQLTNLSEEKVARVVPEPPPKNLLHANDEELDLTAPRAASKSISDLIAALPPSLDFLEESSPHQKQNDAPDSAISYPFLKPRKKTNEVTTAQMAATTSQGTPAAGDSRPQIFQPLGRAEYKSPATEKPATQEKAGGFKAPIPGSRATLSSAAHAAPATAPAPISARSNLPPQPTLRSPLKPGKKIEELGTRSSTAQIEKTLEKSQSVAQKALASASHELKKTSSSFSAAILDLMAISGIATIFLAIILVITGVDLVAMLSHAKTDLATIFHLSMLFVAVMHLYVLSSRCFFGATIGEWSFDLQMGTDEDQKRAAYPLRVMWRMILVATTGVITLPLLSKLIGRDLFAMLGGPQLYRRPL